MQKSKLMLVVVIALMFLVSMVIADDKPWFDMENCSFCQHLIKDPDLMNNMSWKHYDIDDGIMTVTMVKPESQEAYQTAMMKMEEVGKSWEDGNTDIKMCGQCEYYGMLMTSGAKFQYVDTDAGDIMLITSSDPEVVKKIKHYAAKNREELAKWDEVEMKHDHSAEKH